LKKIGIDVDGVIRDFAGDLVRQIQKHYPEYLKNEYDKTLVPNFGGGLITDWYLEKNFNCTKEELQNVYWYEFADEIMGNGDPITENVVELKNWLETTDDELWCVTSQKDHARHHTLTWLGKHGLNFKGVIFERGKYKWKHDVEWLVDDSPENWRQWKKNRDDDNIIVIDQPYNQLISPYYRVNNLKQAREIIDG
tara:strand:- start:105 stop:689 length:585 start_codon:yes stop_codon:yes gene_type:complete